MLTAATKQGFAFLCGFLASSAGNSLGTEPPDILRHPVSQRTFEGDDIQFQVGANSPPLQYQWFKDGAAIEGARAEKLSLINVDFDDVGHYHVVVSNAFGNYTSDAATLTLTNPSFEPGAFDPSFLPSDSVRDEITTLLALPDGSTLVADKDARLLQVRESGEVDRDFNQAADGPNARIRAMAMVGEDRVLLAGDFTIYNGVACHNICMVELDGTLSDAFENTLGVNDSIRVIEVLPSTKLLIAGLFTKVNGQTVNFLARLMPDGTLDASFEADSTIDRRVSAIALGPNDQILVAGRFTERLLRLNGDGSLDPSFPMPEANAPVTSISVQSSGHAVLGGTFSMIQGVRSARLARLQPNGEIDIDFPNHNPDSSPTSVHLDSQDRILVTGEFRRFGGESHSGVVRLLANGQIDRNFLSVPLIKVETAAQHTNGDWLIGGEFEEPRRGLVRLRGEPPKEGFPPKTLAPIIYHEGQSALSVNASAYPKPDYVWRFNGHELLDQTSSELHLASLDRQGVGTYQVTAKNPFGVSDTLSIPFAIDEPTPFAPEVQQYVSNGPPMEIPNRIGRSLISTITVPDDFIVERVTVRLDVTHDAIDQLTAELFAPGNPMPVILFQEPNEHGSGRNLRGTSFDDAAPEALSVSLAPFVGTYRVAVGSLRQLTGKSALGEWRLRLSDRIQTSGTGILQGWTVQLRPQAASVSFENWSILVGDANPLTYALTEPSLLQTSTDTFGNFTMVHQRWIRPEDILYQYETSEDLLDWQLATSLRLQRQRRSNGIEEVRVTWKPDSTQRFLRLRTVLP